MEWLPILVVGLVVLVCPLLMHFGMRGIHGSHGSEHMARAHDARAHDASANTTERLHQLELEVTELKQQLAASEGDEARLATTNGGSPSWADPGDD